MIISDVPLRDYIDSRAAVYLYPHRGIFDVYFAIYLMATTVYSVVEWLRAWDTLTMFEATVCGRS